MEDSHIEEGDSNKDLEVAPALIAVHPNQKSVAVAIGSDLRVFDVQAGCSVSMVDDSGGALHKDSIRAIRFDAEGKLFVSAGDDKLVKIWETGSEWRCISTVCSEKRVTAVAIRNDGLFVCFADKFGVVWVVDLDGSRENQPLNNKKPVSLLAHYCSIITSLEFSPDGGFIVSADRDFKIRVTVFPKKPLDGAHEIQSFCLGHTEFVSCLAFVFPPDYPEGFLVSGSGDSTVRMWDVTSGLLLHTCDVGAEATSITEGVSVVTGPDITNTYEAVVKRELGKAGLLESSGKDQQYYPAVTDICATPDGALVAVAIQSLQGIMLLSCDITARTLSFVKVVSVPGEMFIPTSIGIGTCADLLWMVTGVSNLDGANTPSLARVRAVSGFTKSSPDVVEHDHVVLEDNEIPGGEKLLEKLQGSMSIENKVFVAAAEAVKNAMCSLLIKKQYTHEKREFRKRTRNDKKTKQ